MATYRDDAIAAYTARRTAWVPNGQDRLVPLMTNAAGTKVLDPYGKTTVAHEDQDEDLVILSTTDGSNVSFAVWPNHPERAVRVVELVDAEWTTGPEVRDLDDVGAALIGEAV